MTTSSCSPQNFFSMREFFLKTDSIDSGGSFDFTDTGETLDLAMPNPVLDREAPEINGGGGKLDPRKRLPDLRMLATSSLDSGGSFDMDSQARADVEFSLVPSQTSRMVVSIQEELPGVTETTQGETCVTSSWRAIETKYRPEIMANRDGSQSQVSAIFSKVARKMVRRKSSNHVNESRIQKNGHKNPVASASSEDISKADNLLELLEASDMLSRPLERRGRSVSDVVGACRNMNLAGHHDYFILEDVGSKNGRLEFFTNAHLDSRSSDQVDQMCVSKSVTYKTDILSSSNNEKKTFRRDCNEAVDNLNTVSSRVSISNTRSQSGIDMRNIELVAECEDVVGIGVLDVSNDVGLSLTSLNSLGQSPVDYISNQFLDDAQSVSETSEPLVPFCDTDYPVSAGGRAMSYSSMDSLEDKASPEHRLGPKIFDDSISSISCDLEVPWYKFEPIRNTSPSTSDSSRDREDYYSCDSNVSCSFSSNLNLDSEEFSAGSPAADTSHGPFDIQLVPGRSEQSSQHAEETSSGHATQLQHSPVRVKRDFGSWELLDTFEDGFDISQIDLKSLDQRFPNSSTVRSGVDISMLAEPAERDFNGNECSVHCKDGMDIYTILECVQSDKTAQTKNRTLSERTRRKGICSLYADSIEPSPSSDTLVAPTTSSGSEDDSYEPSSVDTSPVNVTSPVYVSAPSNLDGQYGQFSQSPNDKANSRKPKRQGHISSLKTAFLRISSPTKNFQLPNLFTSNKCSYDLELASLAYFRPESATPPKQRRNKKSWLQLASPQSSSSPATPSSPNPPRKFHESPLSTSALSSQRAALLKRGRSLSVDNITSSCRQLTSDRGNTADVKNPCAVSGGGVQLRKISYESASLVCCGGTLVPLENLFDRQKTEKNKGSRSQNSEGSTGRETKKAQQFGLSLQDLKKNTGRIIPAPVEDTVEYLKSTAGDEVEGLFRRCARVSTMKEVQEKYDDGEKVNFHDYNDPHLAAAILKKFLRELQEPLMTFDLFEPITRLHYLEPSKQLNEVQRILQDELPEDNYIILKFVFQFLQQVVSKSDINHMTAENVATVFGPNIAWPKGQANLVSVEQAVKFALILLQSLDDVFLR